MPRIKVISTLEEMTQLLPVCEVMVEDISFVLCNIISLCLGELHEQNKF